MQNPNLSFAKIVATPTETSWSQIYNAGGLFVVISLSIDEPLEDQPLTAIGKQVINNLEAEFFTLEKKDLQSIKKAVIAGLSDLPEHILLSLALTYVKENVLYVLLYGQGKIILKRGPVPGVLLVNHKTDRSLISASGYLQNDDLLLLQTEHFASLVSDTDLQAAFELTLPNDIAETLTPNVHKAEDGAASAIVIMFKGVPNVHVPATKHIQNENADESATANAQYAEDADLPVKPTNDEENFPTLSSSKEKRRTQIVIPAVFKNRRALVFGVLALILIGVLFAGVYTTMQQKQHAKRKAQFEKIYSSAEKEYTEGSGLLSLSPNYAREDLEIAKKTLEDSLPDFPEKSEEAIKLRELLDKVNDALSQTAQVRIAEIKDAKKEDSPVLEALLDNKGLYSAADEDDLYVLTEKDILSITASGSKSIIKNDADWTTPGGFAAYNGNLYVLDKKDGVIKFVAGSGGYGAAAYFSGTSPDLSSAVSMAIDGSVWILYQDGAIKKFTKGQPDSFSAKGLDKPFKTPQTIYTSTDINSLYILDAGNGRIVQLNKDGTFKAQYASGTLSSAKTIAVDEGAKKIYILLKDTLGYISLP